MARNFWDNISPTNNVNQTINNNFNIKDFMSFYKQMQNKNPNQILQNMINSGQVTTQQLEQAKSQANGIYQMLQTMGFIK